MIELLILNILLIAYLFYKEWKNSQTIREIVASKISPETFEKIILNPKKEEETKLSEEPLLDDVDAEELAEKLEGSTEEQ
jgi:hypothetical protein